VPDSWGMQVTNGVRDEFKMTPDRVEFVHFMGFNLRCPSGHRWYSPEPKAWIGSDCGYNVAEGKCREKLERL
jgi:hypothetical protein